MRGVAREEGGAKGKWSRCKNTPFISYHSLSPRAHRGKGLAAFLKAIGYLIPLMDNESANYYTREVMVILIREFQSPDEEMKKIVLKVREGDEEEVELGEAEEQGKEGGGSKGRSWGGGGGGGGGARGGGVGGGGGGGGARGGVTRR